MPKGEVLRRDLLKVLCASTGAVCGGVVGCQGVGAIVKEEEFAKLPELIAGRVQIPLAEYPQLMTVGGGLIGVVAGMSQPLAIVREEEALFRAVDAVCTHMVCTLRYNSLNATLDCPCHGSSFEVDGRVVQGPATKPLQAHPTEFDAARAVLQIKIG